MSLDKDLREFIQEEEIKDSSNVNSPESVIQYLLPKTYAKFSEEDIENVLGLQRLKRAKEEEKKFYENSKGLNVRIYIYNDKDNLNAFTLPGLTTGVFKDIHDGVNPEVVYEKMKANIYSKINAVRNGDIVEFNGALGDDKLIIFVSEGFLRFSDFRHRFAVYLHEIGHWVVGNSSIVPVLEQFLSIYIAISIVALIMTEAQIVPLVAVYVILFVLMMSRVRSIEWKSDKFANDVGYGLELAEALSRLSGNPEQFEKIYDVLNSKTNKIKRTLQVFSDLFSSHPSVERRINKIMKEDQQLELVNEENKEEFIKKMKPVFKELDNFIVSNYDRVIPFFK